MEKPTFTARLKRRWLEFWGIIFFIGVLINFSEIICRATFNFSIDLMYDIPIWLTIWAVMMLSGPILPDGEHVSVDMFREQLSGTPRKAVELFNALCCIAFGVVITWGGIVFTLQCYQFNMNIIRCISVPRWIVESCVPIGMGMFTFFAIVHFINVLKTNYAKADKAAEE